MRAKLQKSSDMSRKEMEALASRVVEMGLGEGEGYLHRLAARLESEKIQIPTVTLEYRDVEVDADALLGSAALPSLSQTAKRILYTLAGRTKNQTKELRILKGISGVLKPGRMTLILGPPGSGKSVFLQLLAGKLKPSSTLRIRGDLKYNGASKEEFVIERTAAYVEQLDNHLGSLTVHETLEYAFKFQVGTKPEWNLAEEIRNVGSKRRDKGTEMTSIPSGSKEDGLNGMSDKEFDELVQEIFGTAVKVEAVIKFLGLSRCEDTMVGDAMSRGISGGERKRLTSAEMLVGPRSLLLMDEISTGLDAATLFSVIKWLRSATHSMRLNTVVSLLQPSPEVFVQFDDVILLTDGKVIYHGPIPQAIPFFTSLGFSCPERKDHASFLQEITTTEGQLEYATDELKAKISPEVLSGKQLLVSLDDLQNSYWESRPGQEMKELLAKPMDRDAGHPKALVHDKYALSLWESVKLVTARQVKMTRRNKVLAKGRIAQVFIMGLLIGSLYWDQGSTLEDSRTIFGISFLIIMFMAMGNMIQMQITMMNKSVFYKHKDNFFFPALSYACGMAFTQIPFSFVESTVFSLTTYFMVGLSLDSTRYFLIYWLVVFSFSCGSSALFRFIPCVTPNMVVTNSVGGVTLLMLVVNSGFTIVRKSIPGYWIWAYWISPFAYGVRALAINEFTSPRWSSVTPGLGESALLELDFHTSRSWIWIGIAYIWGMYIVLTLGAAVALHCLRGDHKQAVLMDENEIQKARSEAIERKKILKKSAAGDVEDQGKDFSVSEGLPFQPITLVFKDLGYSVDLSVTARGKQKSGQSRSLQLLQGITGHACPGVLTALMGGTGAGKTTLMDVIAGRKTQGTITGEMYVNGYPKDQKTWSRVVGYVEQFDSHSATPTVREALEYSARLRLDTSVSSRVMQTVVDEVLEIVDLIDIQHAVVGTKEGTGLSLEQSKRLSIAVELVANPSVVFMDEPTSGLDARAAATVMRAVKNVALNGRTVMVTIHQPSIEIFEAFDNLILLQMGGRLIYFGPLGYESCRLIQYLEAAPGVPKIEPGYNPATWMLEVTGGAAKTMVAAADADFPEIYENHDICAANEEDANQLVKESAATHSPLTLSGHYAIPLSWQISVLMKKFLITYWRSPAYNFVRMVVTIVTALVFGSVYWGKGSITADENGFASAKDVQNIMGVLFVGMSFMGMTNLISSLPMVASEREVFYRERAASMYSSFPYALATGLVEVPYLLCQAALFVPIVYFMVDFDLSAEKFFYFFIVFFQSISLYTFFAQMLVYLLPSAPLASVIGGAFHFLWTLFNGFLIAESQIPAGWKWMNKITPTTYIIYGLSVSQLGENDTPIIAFGQTATVKEFLKRRFDFEYSFRWWCVGILCLFIVVFRVLTIIAVKCVQHQRR
ncbi:hypothetical protein BSKO_00190 [Bryopsis sp. KO-2023]|nr:hypothetical protein BSKO_00190 [Bryopsis sp. KO-2023]